MLSIPLILAIIACLIVLNGILSAMEIALVSVSRARLKRFEQENKAGATAALALQKNIDEFFATVQIGITFVGTLSAAIGGAVSADLFAPLLEYAGISSSTSAGQMISLIAVTVCLSYVSLIVGELVPKSVARRYPGTLSVTFARAFSTFSRLMAPGVRILSVSTAAVLRLLRIPVTRKSGGLTTEEFRLMASELAESGEIPVRVHDMLLRITRLAEIRVEDVMVPRHRIVAVEADSPLDPKLRDKILDTYRRHPFTVFPVMDRSSENLLGTAHVKDLLLDPSPDSAPLRPVTFIPRGQTLDRILSLMRANNTQLSVVVDEHGVVDGIITLEDVLEELVGEIESGTRMETVRIPTRKDGAPLVVDGLTSLHELKDLYGVALPQSQYYSTLAGFVLDRIAKIPRPGDSFVYGQWRFEVLTMDRNRIKRVRILPAAAADL